jgi:hypothetical protein
MIQGHTDVFTDYVSITSPLDDGDKVMEGISPLLDLMGAAQESSILYRFPEGGTLKAMGMPSRGVHYVSASGRAIASIRSRQLLDTFLMSFSQVPHNVSRMDIAMDVPLYAPDLLPKVYREAHEGRLRVTRKSRPPKQTFGPVPYEMPSKRVTGSVYLNDPRKAEIALRIYDKRAELLERTGEDIGEDRVRLELVLGKSGASLRDVSQPLALFYHRMPECLVTRPPGPIPDWVPTSEPFHVERIESLPYERLKALVESSSDVGRILKLTDELGPEGYRLFLKLLGRRHLHQSGLSGGVGTSSLAQS